MPNAEIGKNLGQSFGRASLLGAVMLRDVKRHGKKVCGRGMQRELKHKTKKKIVVNARRKTGGEEQYPLDRNCGRRGYDQRQFQLGRPVEIGFPVRIIQYAIWALVRHRCLHGELGREMR
jgi:hypothetical protein